MKGKEGGGSSVNSYRAHLHSKFGGKKKGGVGEPRPIQSGDVVIDNREVSREREKRREEGEKEKKGPALPFFVHSIVALPSMNQRLISES